LGRWFNALVALWSIAWNEPRVGLLEHCAKASSYAEESTVVPSEAGVNKGPG
jgi:hypothetical protein